MKLPAILALGVALGPVACSDPPSKHELIGDALAARSANKPKKRVPMPIANHWSMLAVMAGQGLGPIRIDANVSHVERLMQRKCEIRTETLCRYVNSGIDFNLLGGITTSMVVQRRGRPAGKSATGEELEFGFFYGMIPPDLRLGMTPEAIQQYLGKPYRAEKVPGPNPQNTAWRHYYPGMTLEYDFWPETKKLILGGIHVFKDPEHMPAAAASDAGAPPSDAGAPPSDAGAKPTPRDAGPPRLREPH